METRTMSDKRHVTQITKNLGYFAASHNLPSHDGGCWNLHGHNYGVTVTLEGWITHTEAEDYSVPHDGMIIDFTYIKDIYKEHIHSVVDHAHLFGTKLPSWYYTFIQLVKADNDTTEEDAMESVDIMLGKVAHLPIQNTTAELMAGWILDTMQQGLTQYLSGLEGKDQLAVRIVAVELSETESSIARVTYKE